MSRSNGRAASMLDYHQAKARVLDTFERWWIRQVLSLAEGNVSRAARMADVDRSTLYRLIRRHDVEPNVYRREAS